MKDGQKIKDRTYDELNAHRFFYEETNPPVFGGPARNISHLSSIGD